jgi:ribosomal 30S subunit maturation factor RimM
VLVLRGERERLVPLVRERLVDVDLGNRRLTLDWHPDD